MKTTLKELRVDSPYTVQDVANQMKVTTRTIYLWEKGERQISAVNLYRLMSLYKSDITIANIPHLIPESVV